MYIWVAEKRDVLNVKDQIRWGKAQAAQEEILNVLDIIFYFLIFYFIFYILR